MNDLSDLDMSGRTEVPQKMVLLHPQTFEPIIGEDGQEMYLMLVGEDSQSFIRIEKSQRDAAIRRQGQNGGRSGRLHITADQIDAEAKSRIVACTKDWHIFLDGEWTAFSEENVRAFYTRFPYWYRSATSFIAEQQNFLAPLPEKSSPMPAGHSGNQSSSGKKASSRHEEKSGQPMNGQTEPLTLNP
jgi:hypothetical protein